MELEKISKNKVVEIFKSWRNDDLMFCSFWNKKETPIEQLANYTLTKGYAKPTLQVELHSDFVRLNHSRLDLKDSNYYYSKTENNEFVIVQNKNYDNIIIYALF